MLPIDRAKSVYEALRRTPFASLYGSSNWHDDLAEYVTWYHLTQKLTQPYRIVIREAGKETFAYEPMKSQIVRAGSIRWTGSTRTAGANRMADLADGCKQGRRRRRPGAPGPFRREQSAVSYPGRAGPVRWGQSFGH